MDDSDGDDVWEITVRRPKNETSFYTFTNGNCPNYSCKEDIAGQSCAAGQFNDRQYINVNSDTTISTCFAECTTDLMCTPVIQPVNVTFRIEIDTAVASGMFIGGNFENWGGNVAMEDNDGDNIWEAVVPLTAGTYEYKFINGAMFRNGGETLDSIADASCTLTTGTFTNRLLNLGGTADTTLCVATFAECCGAASINDLLVDNNLFVLRPTLVSDFAYVELETAQPQQAQLQVLNAVGQIIHRSEFNTSAGVQRLDVSSYTSGLYFVQVKVGNRIGTQKMMVD
jgi:hypothetical protein